MTARVWKWAVANKEIILNLLKVRKQAIGHHNSKRLFMTARVAWMAVEFAETTFELLLVEI